MIDFLLRMASLFAHLERWARINRVEMVIRFLITESVELMTNSVKFS